MRPPYPSSRTRSSASSRAPATLAARDLLHAQAVLDVLLHGHVRKERVVLEHGVDVARVGGQPGHVLAAQLDPALVGPLEAGDHAQGRRLARAGRAEHREELAPGDLEVDPVHGDHVAVALAEPGDAHIGVRLRRQGSPPGSRARARARRRRTLSGGSSRSTFPSSPQASRSSPRSNAAATTPAPAPGSARAARAPASARARGPLRSRRAGRRARRAVPAASGRARPRGCGTSRSADRVEHDRRRGARDRVAAESAAEPARAGASMISARPVTAASGSPPPSDLPETSRSGSTPLHLDRPHRPGPTDARLHLVRDEDDLVTVAQLAEPGEVVVRHRNEAPFALHGLEHDACDRLGIDVAAEEVLQRGDRGVRVDAAVGIGRQRAVDLAGKRAETGLVGPHLARHRHRQERAPVEAVIEDDDRWATGRRAGDLDRVLDRLGPGVDEHRLLAARAPARRQFGEPPADGDVRLVGADHEALVQEAIDLLVDRGDHWPEAVPGVLTGDPAGEVEIDGSVGRLDARALRPRDHERRRRDASRDVAAARLEDVGGRCGLVERHGAILSRPAPAVQWTAGRPRACPLRHAVVNSLSWRVRVPRNHRPPPSWKAWGLGPAVQC